MALKKALLFYAKVVKALKFQFIQEFDTTENFPIRL